jgi:CTP:molybdopterin cytidylyltransferase MocA
VAHQTELPLRGGSRTTEVDRERAEQIVCDLRAALVSVGRSAVQADARSEKLASASARVDGERPRGPQPIVEGQSTVLLPERVGGDVLHHPRAVPETRLCRRSPRRVRWGCARLVAGTAIVLAAGQGTRMKSGLPKVLHPLAGRPMIHYVVDAAIAGGRGRSSSSSAGTAASSSSAYLAKAFGDRVRTAVQAEQRGTGHAVSMRSAREVPRDDATSCSFSAATRRSSTLPSDHSGLVDAPPRRAGAAARDAHREASDPTGYGRILRDAERRVVGIREHKDCAARSA